MSIAADAPASIGPIRREWRGFWLAVQFFTRLPTPQFEGFRAEWLNDAAKDNPVWVRAVAATWAEGSASPATRRILARGTRSLVQRP